jgi:hypothetical protein
MIDSITITSKIWFFSIQSKDGRSSGLGDQHFRITYKLTNKLHIKRYDLLASEGSNLVLEAFDVDDKLLQAYHRNCQYFQMDLLS